MRTEIGSIIVPCWSLFVRARGPQLATMDMWRPGEHAIVMSIDVQTQRWTSGSTLRVFTLLIGRRVRLIDVRRDDTSMFKVVSR